MALRDNCTAARQWSLYGRADMDFGALRRLTYDCSASLASVKDEDGKDVTFERLLLPFGSGETVERIIGSYKAISIEGGFKVENLMGVRADTRPVRLLSAVVDQELARRPPGVRISDDIVEAD